MPVMTRKERKNQYTSKASTAQATARAPWDRKSRGIQAGASRRIQVIRPGAASSRRSPAWRTGEGGLAATAGVGGEVTYRSIMSFSPLSRPAPALQPEEGNGCSKTGNRHHRTAIH